MRLINEALLEIALVNGKSKEVSFSPLFPIVMKVGPKRI
jgi:hypothetical protein